MQDAPSRHVPWREGIYRELLQRVQPRMHILLRPVPDPRREELGRFCGRQGELARGPEPRAQGTQEGHSVPEQRDRPIPARGGQVQDNAPVPRGAPEARLSSRYPDPVTARSEGYRPAEEVRVGKGGFLDLLGPREVLRA